MKKRILFVDDQPNVLDGLRRMLRSFRHEWDMEFAENGQDALERLAAANFDVVVTDMRMPRMDGAQLLDEVRRRHPDTVRIVLSGQSDQEIILRSIGPTHQYLSKPCDPETLKSTVARACALHDKLASEPLTKLVSRVTTLPSMSANYKQLVEELNSPESSVRNVADLISTDIGMTAKVLQLVNSSFFGLARRITSPAQAATLLGLELLKPLVLSAGIFSQFDQESVPGFSIEALQQHSLAVGMRARRIANSQNSAKNVVDDALLAGLMHDVGKLVLAANLHKEYGEILALARDKHIQLWEAELESLGASHTDVGAFLLGLWGLPDVIVEAVAFHHEPQKSFAHEFGPLTAVHVANVLENKDYPSDATGCQLTVDAEYLEQVGMTERLEAWGTTDQKTVAEGNKA